MTFKLIVIYTHHPSKELLNTSRTSTINLNIQIIACAYFGYITVVILILIHY